MGVLLSAVLLLLVISHQTMRNVKLNRSVRARHDAGVSASWPPTEQLEAILAMSHNNHSNASNNANKNKRLVVAAANYGYVDFADNFAHQLLTHLKITNVVLVPLDLEAYKLLHKAYPEHTLPVMPDSLLTKGAGGEDGNLPPPTRQPPSTTSLLRRMWRWIADSAILQRLWWIILWLTPGREARDAYAPTFNSRGFRELTATRPVFLRAFLQKGYSVLYSDIDTVWQQNLWEYVDEERQTSRGRNNNDTAAVADKAVVWKDGPTHLCTCLMYLPAPPATNPDGSGGRTALTLLDHWIAAIRTGTYANDQPAFNAVWKSATGLGTPVRVVPNSDAFPTGAMFFDGVNADDLADLDKNKNHADDDKAAAVERRRNKAVVIHNNFIKGRRNKLARFEAYDLWHPSGKL